MRGGPCAELSLWSYDRVLYGTCVRLERRAVKVACVVLRGLGGCEPTWLPGGMFHHSLCFYLYTLYLVACQFDIGYG